MTIKQMLACLVVLAVFIVGNTSMVVAQESSSTHGKPTLKVPDIDALDAADTKAKNDAGPCCHTKGTPECGGSCDICCKKNERASCVAGSCNPNNTFACTCQVVTKCTCN